MIKYWLKALRYHFTAPSFISALLGSAIAVNLGITFNVLYFVLLIIAIVCNHCALNMTDDYYDYLGIDFSLDSTATEDPEDWRFLPACRTCP